MIRSRLSRSRIRMLIQHAPNQPARPLEFFVGAAVEDIDPGTGDLDAQRAVHDFDSLDPAARDDDRHGTGGLGSGDEKLAFADGKNGERMRPSRATKQRRPMRKAHAAGVLLEDELGVCGLCGNFVWHRLMIMCKTAETL